MKQIPPRQIAADSVPKAPRTEHPSSRGSQNGTRNAAIGSQGDTLIIQIGTAGPGRMGGNMSRCLIHGADALPAWLTVPAGK